MIHENNSNHTQPVKNGEAKSLDYASTTFFGMLKLVKHVEFTNWSLVWAAILTLALFTYVAQHGNLYADGLVLATQLIGPLLGGAAAILAVVIAALAVTLAVFKESLLPKMLHTGLLQKFLFPFWLATGIWAVNIVACLFLYVTAELNQVSTTVIGFIAEVFFFLFGVFYTVSLTGMVIRLALQRAETHHQD